MADFHIQTGILMLNYILSRRYLVLNMFFFVFSILSHYCSSCPSLVSGIRAGKRNNGLEIFTRSFPCFKELRSIFYVDKVKIIPDNIYELLTPVALAHMIMGDGSVSRHGLVLCTNSYRLEEVVLLMNVLMIRYELECTIHKKRRNQKIEHMIYIRQGSMPSLLNIVSPYMHESMLYKLKSSLSKPSNVNKI